MPGLFSGEDRDDTALEAIVQYLSALKTPVKEFPKGDVENGRKLYHTIGCVACHEPAKLEDFRPPEAPANVEIEKPLMASVPILLADRYDRNALVAFLLDPLGTRPDGRMPRTAMTEQEAADLADYLQINREPLQAKERAELKIKPPTVEEGRQAFVKMNCIACHENGEKALPDAGWKARAPLPLASVQAGNGCLSGEKKAGVPDYGFNALQKRAITLALSQ